MNDINEKVSWKSILLALGIGLAGRGTISKYKEYKEINGIYKSVNSSKQMSPKDIEIVNDIRSEIIEEIKNSNLFKKFGQQYIIDSIKNINIRIVDEFPNNDTSFVAMYINVGQAKKEKTFANTDDPSVDNIILVKRSSLGRSDFAGNITHEIYHYLDRLIPNSKSKSYKYSSDDIIIEYLDKKINNPELAKKKISILITGNDIVEAKYKELIDITYDEIQSHIKYYTSSSEIFARYKTLKSNFLKKGYIDDINQTITIEIISDYLYKNNFYDIGDDITILYLLDYTKFPELDKII